MTKTFLAAAVAAGLALPASAAIISVTGDGEILATAPAAVLDNTVTNTLQQGFNEVQNYTLLSDLEVDGGFIKAGTRVDSHMIFLNASSGRIETSATWTFGREILGTMSDTGGLLEEKSTGVFGSELNALGLVGVSYPSAFGNRGLESGDSISFSGATLELDMVVTQPGDWVRVVTAPVPLPAAAWMLIAGLGGLGYLGRKRRAA